MIKQYKLRNYHFQLIAFIVVLNIIGILLIIGMGLFAICSFLIANDVDKENESISNHTEKEIKHERNMEKL